jgi:hypothetical protein
MTVDECSQVGFWDDVFLVIPFLLGVVFFHFVCPRRPARGSCSALAAEEEPTGAVVVMGKSMKDFEEDLDSVSTAEGSDSDREELRSPSLRAR